MNQSTEIPDSVYLQLMEVAEAEGTTPGEWIQHHLHNEQHRIPTREEVAEAYGWLDRCIVNLCFATSDDNKEIEAEIARAHPDPYQAENPNGDKA